MKMHSFITKGISIFSLSWRNEDQCGKGMLKWFGSCMYMVSKLG